MHGGLGVASRFLSVKYGSPFTYAAFNKERGIAPGIPVVPRPQADLSLRGNQRGYPDIRPSLYWRSAYAHIDSAWLWPVRETIRKVARTTSNVVQLLDTHPDLVYAMSSAQQFAWLEQHRPDVFARVAHVRAGRFVPVGGMWVESDTNMPGGEAMARQFVHGKRFFLERFSVECQEVWLPDSFGYSAALPQIAALAGCRWLLTQKISWNQVNTFPHHTFWWEGIDGTRVFTHFPPVDTYNSELSGAELAHAADNFREKGMAGRSLVPFGWGDGGGGPTREMIARARRTADLEGSPKVTIARPQHSSPRRRRSMPMRRCGPVSCTWRSIAGPTRRRQRRSRATGEVSTCCGRPSCSRRQLRSGVCSTTRTKAWIGSGSWCCCSSSTTSCRAARSPGCTAKPSRTTSRSLLNWRI